MFALKAICVMPGNPARGLDAHQGIVTLFDGETGVPDRDPRRVGDHRDPHRGGDRGRDARARARGCPRARDPRRRACRRGRTSRRCCAVREFDEVAGLRADRRRTRGRSPRAPAPSRRRPSPRAPRTRSAGADVVVTATSSREPVLERELARARRPRQRGRREHRRARASSTSTTVAASALFVDSRESLRNEAGEYQLALSRGAIARRGPRSRRARRGARRRAPRAPGRRRQLTLFRSLGLAVEDLAAAELAVARRARRGRGTEVEL